MTTTMTFEQFQASKRFVTNLGAELKDECLDGHTGYLYADVFYIDIVASDWPQEAQQKGKYHLLLGNSETISNDLAELEGYLYEYAIVEGDIKREAAKTTINLDAITGMDLWEASRGRDIDAAIAKLQEKAGITDGGIAGMVFSGFNWPTSSPDQRAHKIKEWIETERTYAADMARAETEALPDGAIPWDLGGGFKAVMRLLPPDGEYLTIMGPVDGVGTYVEIELEPASVARLRAIFRSLDALDLKKEPADIATLLLNVVNAYHVGRGELGKVTSVLTPYLLDDRVTLQDAVLWALRDDILHLTAEHALSMWLENEYPDPTVSIRKEDGTEVARRKLSEWALDAREVLDPEDVDLIEEMIRRGNSYFYEHGGGKCDDLPTRDSIEILAIAA